MRYGTEAWRRALFRMGLRGADDAVQAYENPPKAGSRGEQARRSGWTPVLEHQNVAITCTNPLSWIPTTR